MVNETTKKLRQGRGDKFMNRNIINRLVFGDILKRNAKILHDKEFAVSYGYGSGSCFKRLTYGEMDKKANQFANALIELGLQKGDKIATIAANSIEFLVAFFGASKCGVVIVPLNPVISLEDIEYQLKHSETKFVIVDDEFFPKFKTLLKNNKLDYILIPITEGFIGKTFKEFIADKSCTEPEVEIRERDILEILYTSGTTALPKGVMESHMNVICGALNAALSTAYIGMTKPNSISATVMPLFHCAQQAVTFGAALIPGGKTVIFRSFIPNDFFEAVEKEKITLSFLLPTMLRALLDQDTSKYDISSLKYMLYAMTPMDENTKRRLIKELGLTIMLASGQTEAFPPTIIFFPEHQLQKTGNYWGTPLFLTEHAIMNERGELLPKNEKGEIVLRGPNVMEGYYKDEEATDKASSYNWHHMGDIGFFDDDNLLKFDDRIKDMVKTGGENVPSIKVEGVLLGHPKVAEAAVIGVPNEKWGEAVTALVVPKDPLLKEKELLSYCKERLADFEVPKKIVFVESFPKTATGKIQKFVLRSKFEKLFL